MGADDRLAAERLRREVIGAAVLEAASLLGDAIPWDRLQQFELPDGTRQRLLDGGGGGIWNPADFVASLSITTSPDGPYADKETEAGLLQYHYQKGPEGGKNLKMRVAMDLGLPLVRFNKVAPGYYQPIYPVFVVGDNPIAREFTLSLDEVLRVVPGEALSPLTRAYAERLVSQRVHQPAFRARVLLAYERQCSVCKLRHPELLDAAHIIEDRADRGDPVVPNGLSLCKIHHAAFDRRLLGISPQLVVHINDRLLREHDGPMLRHGLQEMHGRALHAPTRRSDRPDPERLQQRFEAFLAS